jgi:hypothetical protein
MIQSDSITPLNFVLQFIQGKEVIPYFNGALIPETNVLKRREVMRLGSMCSEMLCVSSLFGILAW